MTDRNSSSNLWLFFELLARRRNFIVSFVVILTIIATVTVFLLPKWYQSTALMLPPKEMTAPVAGLAALSEVVSVTKGLDLPVLVTPSDVYARMLRSRTITGKVIDSFNLQLRYKTDNAEDTYEALMDHAKFNVTDEGLLQVVVEDKDPEIAADMANAFVDELDKVNRHIVSERARENREFIEDRLATVKAELEKSRSDLEAFQEKNKTVDFDQQIHLAVEQAIDLKTSLAKLDIDIMVKEKTLGPDNAELIDLKRRREMYQKQLEQLERKNPDNSYFSLPISDIPGLRGQYEVLYSRVKVGEGLYKVLLEQLENAKIAENEKSSTISVLDRATPADVKSRPRRTLIVGTTFGFSIFFALLFAAIFDYVDRLRAESPENYRRIMMFVDAFFGWIPGVRKRTSARQ